MMLLHVVLCIGFCECTYCLVLVVGFGHLERLEQRNLIEERCTQVFTMQVPYEKMFVSNTTYLKHSSKQYEVKLRRIDGRTGCRMFADDPIFP